MTERLLFNPGGIVVATTGSIRTPAAPPPPRAIARASPAARKADAAGYGALCVFTAVLLVRPQDQIPGLGALHLAEVAGLAGIIPMFWQRVARGQPPVPLTSEVMALLAFGAAIIVTAPFSIWPGGALSVFTDAYVKAVIIYILMINTLTTAERLERFTWLMLTCIGYVAVRGAANYAMDVNLVEDGRLAGPVGGIFGNPNDLALNMVTFLPLALVTALSTWPSRGRRLTAAAIALPMMAAIVFTKSRGGAIGFLATIVALVVVGRSVGARIAITATLCALCVLPFAPASFWHRMSSITDAQQDREEFTGSRDSRQRLMEESLQVFEERPLTGVGAGQFKNYNPPGRQETWHETHNVVLQVAAETGVFGLAAFIALIVCAWRAASRTRHWLRRTADNSAAHITPRERRFLNDHAVATTAALAGWLACAMFASVAYNWTLYYLLGLIIAAREIARAQSAPMVAHVGGTR